MLVLSRKPGEEIAIGDHVVVKIVSIRGRTIRLGIEAPKEVPVHRREIVRWNGLGHKAVPPGNSAVEENPL